MKKVKTKIKDEPKFKVLEEPIYTQKWGSSPIRIENEKSK